jgi:hypothetical protein
MLKEERISHHTKKRRERAFRKLQKKDQFCVNKFVIEMRDQWKWFFLSNISRKIDQDS